MHVADTFNEAVDSRAPQTGQFFVYGRVGKDKSEELVLCVVYKEKLTHHLTQFVDGSWVINKKSYGHFATIEEVCYASKSGNARCDMKTDELTTTTIPSLFSRWEAQ